MKNQDKRQWRKNIEKIKDWKQKRGDKIWKTKNTEDKRLKTHKKVDENSRQKTLKT
jgi:hypothetical protein